MSSSSRHTCLFCIQPTWARAVCSSDLLKVRLHFTWTARLVQQAAVQLFLTRPCHLCIACKSKWEELSHACLTLAYVAFAITRRVAGAVGGACAPGSCCNIRVPPVVTLATLVLLQGMIECRRRKVWLAVLKQHNLLPLLTPFLCVRSLLQGMMQVPQEEDVRAAILRHEGIEDKEVGSTGSRRSCSQLMYAMAASSRFSICALQSSSAWWPCILPQYYVLSGSQTQPRHFSCSAIQVDCCIVRCCVLTTLHMHFQHTWAKAVLLACAAPRSLGSQTCTRRRSQCAYMQRRTTRRTARSDAVRPAAACLFK